MSKGNVFSTSTAAHNMHSLFGSAAEKRKPIDTITEKEKEKKRRLLIDPLDPTGGMVRTTILFIVSHKLNISLESG